MANNITIIGNIDNVSTFSRYNDKDRIILTPSTYQEFFGGDKDYIEYSILDYQGNIVDIKYNYFNYKLPSYSVMNEGSFPIIEIDPIEDLKNEGYESGEIQVRYNFFRNILGDNVSVPLYISEISPSRTELRLSSNVLEDSDILDFVSSFKDKQNSVPYYYCLLLNFGNNKQLTSINFDYQVDENGDYGILVKLYEPLPNNISLKDQLWIVEEISDSYIFSINLDKIIDIVDDNILLNPNFDIELEVKKPLNTEYKNLSSLSSYPTLSLDDSINLNINYSKFNEFSHFGSSLSRLNNFYTKIKNIESYKNEYNTYVSLSYNNPSLNVKAANVSRSLNDIINSFDSFEYYLYYNSSSFDSQIKEIKGEYSNDYEYYISSYPKINNIKPYILESYTSSIVQNWISSSQEVAEMYDTNNDDMLCNLIPQYIKDNNENQPYINFINMVGQHFDNIWVYINNITDIWDNDNNLNKGISPNLIYDWLQSFGIKLYNRFGDVDLSNYSIGSNNGSSNFNGDYSPTSSFLNNIPRKDLILDNYKRIYHNLPYLFKTKGSNNNIRSIINIHGITGSILNVLDGLPSVTVSPNVIEGEILSSTKKIETLPNDVVSPLMDISFSPQNQINKYISKSVSSIGGWNISNYIDNPYNPQSNYYPSLSYENNYWMSSSIQYDYNSNDFIRLIQYFDNSLFKLLKDFIPAKNSTLLGTTIKSHVLERVKAPSFKPDVNDDNVYDAEIEKGAIVPIYDYKEQLSNPESYFNGDIEGNTININKYLEQDNIFLTNNKDYTPGGLREGNIEFIFDNTSDDINSYYVRSDFNPVMNVVSDNRKSNIVKKLETQISGNNINYIESEAEFQDSKSNLYSYINSRYEGVKLFGRKYNVWSNGDTSLGKSPVIEHTVKKLGFFNEIVSNKFFPNKSNIVLKYLVDENGRLTEVNKRNRNWEEVQNTFRTGDNVNISLFDSQKFSNQIFTEGNRIIHESGYSYAPVFYLLGNESTSSINSSVFKSINPDTTNNLNKYFDLSLGSGSLIPGGVSSSIEYISSSLINSGSKYEVWNFMNLTGSLSSRGSYLSLGKAPSSSPLKLTSSYYEISSKDNFQLIYDFSLELSASVVTGSVKYFSSSFEVWKYSGSNAIYSSSLDKNEIVSSFRANSYSAVLGKPKSGYKGLEIQYTNQDILIPSGAYLDIYNKPLDTIPTSSIPVTKVGGQLYKQFRFLAFPDAYSPTEDLYFRDALDDGKVFLGEFWTAAENEANLINLWPSVNMFSSLFDNSSNSSAYQTLKFKKTININPEDIEVGNKLSFRLFVDNGGSTTMESVKLIPSGTIKLIPTQGSLNIDNTDICFDQQANALYLSKEMSPYFSQNYYMDPLDNSVKSKYQFLYNLYEGINYPFYLKENDKILIQTTNNDGPVLEYTVDRVEIIGNPSLVYIYVKEDIDGYFNTCNKFFKIIMLKRFIDETSIILNLKKSEGKTSYGFSIPVNINENMISNIDNIMKNVNKQLISNQQSSIQFPYIETIGGESSL